MKILLTGASGFLGRYIENELSNNNTVYSLSRFRSQYNYNLSIEMPKLDQKFDLVIHSAGKAHSVPQTANELNDFFNINVTGTINLLEGLRMSSLPKHFVFISSVSVYGLTAGENIDEKSPLLAEEPYGKSKIEAEVVVKKWCDEHNVVCSILRLPLVVGENPPGNLGSMIQGIKKGYYFNIAGGNARKSMVLASDIAKFILNAAVVGGTYNLTDGMHPTFNELSKSIAQNLDKTFVPNMPLFIANVLAKIGDIRGNGFPINSNKLSKITSTLTFDDSKARMAFAWKPTSVVEGLKKYEDA